MAAHSSILLHGCRCALSAQEAVSASLSVVNGTIGQLGNDATYQQSSDSLRIDLSGLLVMPGLINAHDHLHFALHPRLGNPPYDNYIQWGEEIHATLATVIARYNSIPREIRLWWGGLRNLLSGVTTVCHHDHLWAELQRNDFPVRVLQRYGWTHSLALGGDVVQAHAATPEDATFFIHAAEGIDSTATEEIATLARLGVLDAKTALIHGLAIDDRSLALIRQNKASLIICPSSNQFLFGRHPQMQMLRKIEKIAMGNDSPITATGDLLDEVRYAITHCNIEANEAYRMITTSAAAILRLPDGEGEIRRNGVADLIAVHDTGESAAERMRSLSMEDIVLVMIRGKVQLASDEIRQRLPGQLSEGLEPLWVGSHLRWLRAPVSTLVQSTEEMLGAGKVQMGGRLIYAEDPHAYRNGVGA